MFLSKAKIATAVLLVTALLAAGGTVGVLAYRGGDDKSETKQQPPPPKRGKEKAGVAQRKSQDQPTTEKKSPAQKENDEEDRIRPRDLLYIRVIGTVKAGEIQGVYQVERTGKVYLGLGYGRVNIKGLTLEEAEQAIHEHLSKVLKELSVEVVRPVPDLTALEGRVRDLEDEVRRLRALVDELRKKIRE